MIAWNCCEELCCDNKYTKYNPMCFVFGCIDAKKEKERQVNSTCCGDYESAKVERIFEGGGGVLWMRWRSNHSDATYTWCVS